MENIVMPRKRHVSRNKTVKHGYYHFAVMPRKRHVSRNFRVGLSLEIVCRHASQEACE